MLGAVGVELLVLLVVVALGLAALPAWGRARARAAFFRGLRSHRGVRVTTQGFLGPPRISHGEPGEELVVDAVPGSRGRGQPVWELSARPVRLGRRTSLSVGREGIYQPRRSVEGWQDPRMARDEFEQRYRIGGSAPNVVRGAFLRHDVQDATVALFERRPGYVGCQLQGETLGVLVAREETSAEDVLGWMHAVRVLGTALNRAADVTSAPPPLEAITQPEGPAAAPGVPPAED
jgi:hypothetical protein